MNKVSIVSLGCAKNLTDSEVMLGCLKQAGYEIVPKEDQAEIVIVNTCCFIDSAKQESIDTILEIASYKEEGCLKLLIVAGCMGERYQKEVLEELPEVDAVCGTGDFAEIVSVIERAKKKRGLYLAGYQHAPLDCKERILATPSYTAYLKIAEGCSNCCTYCVIPHIRGSYRSRPMESILEEAARLAEQGVKELILIAQDTSCYGRDQKNVTLAKLLRELGKLKTIQWIRVHYLYPEEITDELLEEMAVNPKVVHYFDIPIQHISDAILRRMARRTSGEQIRYLIDSIRQKMPDAVIRTSIIVGFPGETQADFDELLTFLKEYRLDRVGVFPYSQEEGTPAANFPDQIDENVKLDRQARVMELQYEVVQVLGRKKIGTQLQVLVEGYDKILKLYYGRSAGDSVDVDPKVFFTAGANDGIEPGSFCTVRVEDLIDYDLTGTLVSAGT